MAVPGAGGLRRHRSRRARTSLPGKQYETFYRYEPDGIAQFYYDYDTPKRWVSAIWYRVRSGRVVSRDAIFRRSQYSRVYHYNTKGWLLGYDERGVTEYKDKVRRSFEFDHDTLGKIIRAWWRRTRLAARSPPASPATGRSTQVR